MNKAAATPVTEPFRKRLRDGSPSLMSRIVAPLSDRFGEIGGTEPEFR
jgi:hypothetical protein